MNEGIHVKEMREDKNKSVTNEDTDLAECGGCGALIPLTTSRCPKCHTLFEDTEAGAGLAECGNCGNLIPRTSIECPNCGVNFEESESVGEVPEVREEDTEKKLDVETHPSISSEEERLMAEFKVELAGWKAKGYVVTPLERAIADGDMRALWDKFTEYADNVTKLTALKKRFEALKLEGFKNEKRKVVSKLTDPSLVAEAAEDISRLELLSYLQQGEQAYRANKFESAIQFYDKALKIDPTNKEALFYKKKSRVYLAQPREVDKPIVEVTTRAPPAPTPTAVKSKKVAVAKVEKVPVGAKGIRKPENILSKLTTLSSAHVVGVPEKPGVKVVYKIIGKKQIARKPAEVKDKTVEDEKPEKEEVPKRTMEELEALGNEAYKQADYETALNYYTEALKLGANTPRIWNNKGVILRAINKFSEAIECYERALELDPNYRDAWCNKGFALERLERYEEAIRAYSKSLEITPDYDLALYSRAECMKKLKRIDKKAWKKLRRQL
jgi:tetratricopeptide (TPR) repeat protein/RNA polymerase subunit RPABC4/transcription elongation factor Spt4